MTVLDQNRTPLIDALQTYILEHPAYFRIPAHRFDTGMDAGLTDLLGADVFKADLTEAEGLDDLHAAEGVIFEAQKLAADLWGSEECFFLVNGSTCGIEAMILSAAGPGEKILLARNVHKSVMMGLILSGAVPVWMDSEQRPDRPPGERITAETVEKSLSEHPDIKAVMLVSPTYYGVCSPLKEIAGICHRRNIPLLVDEAHGTHLYFLDKGPEGAVKAGADLVVQSLHKTGGSMTQSSLLHLQGGRIDRNRIRKSLSLVMSTSPSYVLMASLDGARRQLAVRGRELMRKASALALKARNGLEKIPGVTIPETEYTDPLRLVFSGKKAGISGFDLQNRLYRESGVSLELADPVFAAAVITWANSEEEIERLIRGVRRITTEVRGTEYDGYRKDPGGIFGIRPEVVCSPRAAWFAEKRKVSMDESLGMISGESVIPYPPGIPVLYPGERITKEVLFCLKDVQDTGYSLHGPEDRTMKSMSVLSL